MIGIVILPVDLRRTRVRSESSLRGCPHRNQRQKSNVCLWHLAARLRRGNGVIQGKTGKEASRRGLAPCTLVYGYCPEIQYSPGVCDGLLASMNSSLYTADRTTHLKIVLVGLAAAVLIAVIGISARELNLGTDIVAAQTPTVIKAGGPVVFTDKAGPVVR